EEQCMPAGDDKGRPAVAQVRDGRWHEYNSLYQLSLLQVGHGSITALEFRARQGVAVLERWNSCRLAYCPIDWTFENLRHWLTPRLYRGDCTKDARTCQRERERLVPEQPELGVARIKIPPYMQRTA